MMNLNMKKLKMRIKKIIIMKINMKVKNQDIIVKI